MNAMAKAVAHTAAQPKRLPAEHQSVGAPDGAFVRVFSGWRRAVNMLGIAAWLAALAFFWIWWFDPEHIHEPGRYILVTTTLLWVTLVPAYFIFIFAAAKIPTPGAPLPARARVAVVVTKAPSEPFAIATRTLEGALNQNGVVHDTWLADEDPSAEMLAWCAKHGVKVSTRKGVAEYHRDRWPRRTRCKEGNLAYFYDKYGYDNYDFVAQFDCDHRPEPDYLANAIAPFADPAVGYVSAPSICDANAAESWSARGRLYLEASLHGALQAGYNSGWAPLCIGSHYAVRTEALRQVGGLGPELAEDHSTTLLLSAGGWKGVHAINAIAHGDGPETFTDLVVQEFQWARSLVTILLQYSPSYVPRLRGKRLFEFVFAELWYPMFSAMLAMSFILPIAALLSGDHYVDITYVEFLIHILPLSLTMMVLAYWWRATGMFRPADARILSWEGTVFVMLRWPWALFGSVMAVWDWATGRFVDFRITPKGSVGAQPIPFRVIAPYVALSLTAGLTAWWVDDAGTAAGFYFFNLVNAAIYGGLVLLILAKHARENGRQLLPSGLLGLITGLSLVAMAVTIGGAAYVNGPKGLATMNMGITAFTLTETVYQPSGAGQGLPGRQVVRLRPRWHGFGQAPQTQPQELDEQS